MTDQDKLLYGNLLAMVINGRSDVARNNLARLSPETLQDIAYAAPILARLCREAFDELPESEPTE